MRAERIIATNTACGGLSGEISLALRSGHRVPIGIWDLLQWAFQREFASLDFDEVVREVGAAPGVGMEWVMMERAKLGCRVDGGGRSDPHPDADVVASALSAMPVAYGGRPMAVWIAGLARAGRVPDWMLDATPRLFPRDTHINRHGEHARTADAAHLGEAGWPNWQRRNRKGVIVKEVVPYCPVVWRPTPDRVAAARRDYLAWWGALLELQTNLRSGAPLTCFDVTCDMPPMKPWQKNS